MKRILKGIQIIIALIFIVSHQAVAQNNKTVYTTKIELKILNDLKENDIIKINNAFRSYPGKIINHSFGETKNKVFVFISENTDPVDILQVLKMNGIEACYRDLDNGFVSLEGHSTRKLYYKE
jgi:hypothetical protein